MSLVRLLRPLLALLVLVLLLMFSAPVAAGAAVGRDSTPDAILAIPWLTLAVSTVIPLVVALLTKSSASAGLKSITNLLLSAVVAAASAYIDSGGQVAAVDLVGSFLGVILASQVVGHRLLFSHGAEQAVARAVPGGIG